MSSHTQRSNEEVEAVETALRQLVRWGNLPRLRQRLAESSGVVMDRASYSLVVPLETENLRISDVAQRSGVDVSTASRQIVELERLGVVSRRPDPNDARSSIIELTATGKRHLKKIACARREMLTEIMADFSIDELVQLASLLDRLNREIASYLEVEG